MADYGFWWLVRVETRSLPGFSITHVCGNVKKKLARTERFFYLLKLALVFGLV
jgi:hypothetical protein